MRRQRLVPVQEKTNKATKKVISNGIIKGSWCQLGLFVSALLGCLQRGTRVHPSAALLPQLFLFPSTSFEPLSSALCLSSQWFHCAQLKSNHHYPFLAFPPDLHSISASQSFCLQFSFVFPVALVSTVFSSFFFFLISGARSSSRVPAVTPCSHTSAPLCQALALYFFNEHRAEWEQRQINQRSHFHLESKKKQIRRTE